MENEKIKKKFKEKIPHLLLTPGEPAEKYNFIVFQIKPDSRPAVSEITQCKM